LTAGQVNDIIDAEARSEEIPAAQVVGQGV
jgi:hypothetical protein